VSPLAGQLLLESVVAPAVLAGLIVLPTRWFRHRVFPDLIAALAFSAAITLTYQMMLGWPVSTTPDARQKIYLLTIAGALIGVGLRLLDARGLAPLGALAVLGPLWIGWPALIEGRPEAAVLILPIAIAFRISARSLEAGGEAGRLPPLLILMAVTLASVALIARTLSFAELGLALAATLSALILAGPKVPLPGPLLAGITMLSGLWSALLLYSAASPPALLILGAIPCAPLLAALVPMAGRPGRRPGLLLALFLAAAAIALAWIDAGGISV
jgi:hypothetical protein